MQVQILVLLNFSLTLFSHRLFGGNIDVECLEASSLFQEIINSSYLVAQQRFLAKFLVYNSSRAIQILKEFEETGDSFQFESEIAVSKPRNFQQIGPSFQQFAIKSRFEFYPARFLLGQYWGMRGGGVQKSKGRCEQEPVDRLTRRLTRSISASLIGSTLFIGPSLSSEAIVVRPPTTHSVFIIRNIIIEPFSCNTSQLELHGSSVSRR